jgi:hypothetical protein
MKLNTTLADLIPDIDLRWTLRDVRAKRTMILAAKQDHVDELVRRGWAELRDGAPVITRTGMDALDVY